jgi:hypothetical protein
VVVYIRHGSATIWQATIENGDTTGVAFDVTVVVQAGDVLDFGINPRANNGYDATYFNPTIVVTPLGPDTTPPVLSNVTVSNLTGTSATVSWQSDEGSTSQVEYGTTPGYGQTTVLDPTLATTHTVPLSGLLPGVEYHYRVVSADAVGNVETSDDATFTTIPSDGTVYQAEADFDLVQGPVWFYRDSSGASLTVNPSFQWWEGSQPFLFLWADGGHPGTTRDAVRRWVAPEEGTARITGTARDVNTGGGDGVVVYIRHGSATIWQATIENGDTTGVTFDVPVVVQAGDVLDFGINPRANNGYDATHFNPTIVVTPLETVPPVLSNVTVAYATPSSALITWVTDEASNSQVEYGIASSTEMASPELESVVPGTVHMVTISNLVPGSLHHFRARSVDAAGNVGMSPDLTFTTPALPPGTTLHDASSDFSLIQGQGGWTYLSSTGAPMVPNPTPGDAVEDFHGPHWQGAETFLVLWYDGGHPGNSADAVRRWTVPSSGTAHISGLAFTIHPAETGGVVVRIRHGSTTLWQYAFNTGDLSIQQFNLSVPVLQGDTLDFVINGGSANTSDSTYFYPTIVLTPGP